MLSHYEMLFERGGSKAGITIGQLALLTEVEERQLLVEWNETSTDALISKTVHRLFKAQAEQIPDKIATTMVRNKRKD